MISPLKTIMLKKSRRFKIWSHSSIKKPCKPRIQRCLLTQMESMLILESTAKKTKIGSLKLVSLQLHHSLNRKFNTCLTRCPELTNFQTSRLLIIINLTQQSRTCRVQIMLKQISCTHMPLSITISSTSSWRATWRTSLTSDIRVIWRPISPLLLKRSRLTRETQWRLMTCLEHQSM